MTPLIQILKADLAQEAKATTSLQYGEQIKAELLALLKRHHVVTLVLSEFKEGTDWDVHIDLAKKHKLPPEMACVLRSYGCIYVEANGMDQPKEPARNHHKPYVEFALKMVAASKFDDYWLREGIEAALAELAEALGAQE